MARELAPARLRSSRKPGNRGLPAGLICLDCGRFAAQREQAPLPQVLCSTHIFRSRPANDFQA
ncbi:hypothetical protein FCH79_14150 [Pseudomonas koreensis]|nr:hypothetical protein [Pseudomonas koreensis]